MIMNVGLGETLKDMAGVGGDACVLLNMSLKNCGGECGM